MDSKGAVEWRIVWLIIVIISLVVMIYIVYNMYYASSSNPSLFSYFSGLFGGR
ncbi:MAG: hypothetical protein ACP5MT_02080 [Candidatus Acidifodinimicrobium sp.]